MTKFFIEIGTADFDTLLPLAKKGWKGIFVEPVKYLLDNLERIDGCEYENVAISNYNGKTTINYDPNPKEEWQRGIGYITKREDNYIPFRYEPAKPSCHFWTHKFENITKNDVQCMTLDALIDKYDVKHIDFLKIDIEGMEYVILDTYSWKVKPKLIKVEVAHWRKRILGHIQSKLATLGYLVYKEKSDWYCILA